MRSFLPSQPRITSTIPDLFKPFFFQCNEIKIEKKGGFYDPCLLFIGCQRNLPSLHGSNSQGLLKKQELLSRINQDREKRECNELPV
jgi:hypothetical protein